MPVMHAGDIPGLADRRRQGDRTAAAGPAGAAALLVALLAIALLLLVSPNPAMDGLRQIAPARIQLLEPGLGHQARSLASANWSLDFTDQFRFDAVTAQQRAARVGDPRVSAAERQWHFALSEPEGTGPPLALLVATAAGDIELQANATHLASSTALPAYFGAAIGGSDLAATMEPNSIYAEGNRIDLIQSEDIGHVGIRAIFVGSPNQVAAARLRFRNWLERQRLGAAFAAAAGVLASLILLVARQRATAAALVMLAGLQILALTGFGAAAHVPWVWPMLSALAACGVLYAQRNLAGAAASMAFGLALTALLGGIAGLGLTMGDWFLPWPFEALELANEGARPLLLLGGPALVWREGSALLARLRDARLELFDKEQIIAAQQAALEQELRNTAILEERQRFARDMHDGIGGHLQSLLMRVRAERIGPSDIAAELQSGLADLRLMVDSLDQLETGLDQALANFRLRAAPQLEAAGIALDWQVGKEIARLRFEPQATLSLYRSLQELVTNCVRHSGADRLRITITSDPEERFLSIAVDDNGKGFDPEAVRAGKGLINLRRRIGKLNGSLAIAPHDGAGASFAMSLPIAQALAS